MLMAIKIRAAGGAGVVDRPGGIGERIEGQQTCRHAVDPARRNQVSREGLAIVGRIKDRAGKLAGPFGGGRYVAGEGAEFADDLAGIGVKEPKPILAIEESWNAHRSAKGGAELVSLELGPGG